GFIEVETNDVDIKFEGTIDKRLSTFVLERTSDELEWTVYDSRGEDSQVQVQSTLSSFVHTDGETVLPISDETVLDEAVNVGTLDPAENTVLSGTIDFEGMAVEN